MRSPTTRWHYEPFAYATVTGCWIIYTILSFLTPPSSNQFHLSFLQLDLLKITIVLPIAVIWMLSIQGAIAFRKYAHIITGSAEAPGISSIASGLLWIVAYLITMALAGSVTTLLLHTKYYEAAVVLRDHLPPLLSLIAFVFMYRGSQQLVTISGTVTWTKATVWAALAYAIFAFIFVLEFAGTATAPIGANRTSLSILPHSVLLFTLIIPYLSAWFMGILASINIAKYATHVQGIIYRQALHNLVAGILAVVFFAILLQLISFAARFMAGLSLSGILGVLYAILAFYALGFLFIRAGAKKLERIEAVE